MMHESLDPKLFAATLKRDQDILAEYEPELAGLQKTSPDPSLLHRIGSYCLAGIREGVYWIAGTPPPQASK